MSRRHISDILITVLGGGLLLGLIASAWFPQPCPILRDKLIGCPKAQPTYQTAEEKEDASIPHQDVLGSYAFFTVKAQDYREKTNVNFVYRGELDKRTALLQIKKTGGYQTIGLITHPMLVNIAWPSISENGVRLYQKDGTFTSISDFLAHLPSAAQVAADSAAARTYKLADNQYTSLDSGATPTDAVFILTTYSPPPEQARWLAYSHPFNVQDAAVTKDGMLEWAIAFPDLTAGQKPFQLGTVHIDYTRMQP